MQRPTRLRLMGAAPNAGRRAIQRWRQKITFSRRTRRGKRGTGRFTNNIAVITGGTSGIGLAAARQFIKEGAKVVVIGRSPVLTLAPWEAKE
jgi:heterodisulfide reductase subunit A-like polyferredoxin